MESERRAARESNTKQTPTKKSIRDQFPNRFREARSADLLHRAIRIDFPFGMDFITRGRGPRGAQTKSRCGQTHLFPDALRVGVTPSNHVSTKTRMYDTDNFRDSVFYFIFCFTFENIFCGKTITLIKGPSDESKI